MEEDMKIIEDFLLGKKMQYGNGYTHFKQFDAIENLLKRCKELEEENESLVRQYEYQGALMVNEYFSKEQVFKHFIPISVIQNKIDWYKAYEGTVMYKKYNYEEIIQVLDEILEKGNK